jgi:hypothetical protein
MFAKCWLRLKIEVSNETNWMIYYLNKCQINHIYRGCESTIKFGSLFNSISMLIPSLTVSSKLWWTKQWTLTDRQPLSFFRFNDWEMWSLNWSCHKWTCHTGWIWFGWLISDFEVGWEKQNHLKSMLNNAIELSQNLDWSIVQDVLSRPSEICVLKSLDLSHSWT